MYSIQIGFLLFLVPLSPPPNSHYFVPSLHESGGRAGGGQGQVGGANRDSDNEIFGGFA